jgi:zinc D-Ala-D-Ala carboxypeptidase
VPSHRADTPPDAPTTVRTRPSAHPQQRRRDLREGSARAHRPTPSGGPSWLDDAAATRALPGQRAITVPASTVPAPTVPSSRTPETWGALALDPLFVNGTALEQAGWVVAEPADDDATHDATHDASNEASNEAAVDDAAVDGMARSGSAPPRLDQVWRDACPSAGGVGTSAGRRVATRSALQRAQLRLAPEPEPAAGRRTGAFGLPHVSIAGALGLATIAVPLTGAFGVVPGAKTPSGTVAAAASALAPLPPFPLASRPPVTALDDPRLLPDEEPAASVPARLAAPRVLLVGGPVSRSNERSVLPGCNGQVPNVALQNGQLPASILCTLWDPKRQLRADAAVAIAKLNIAYQQHFGHPMCFTDAYRSLQAQFRVKAERGGFAARPGTSEHGWGLAVDLCDGVEGGASSASYQWLRENALFYGWQNPTWALPGGAGPFEPWHWEYFRGEKDQSSGD